MKTALDIIECSGIEVAHNEFLDGGGSRSWSYFVDSIRENVGSVEHAYEWCSGPGYIGFALLGAGLCEHLTLADINPEAVEACRETVRRNGLEDRVDVYLSDNLKGIPAEVRWDLVVGDPPHFEKALDRHIEAGVVLRAVDEDWKIHEEFFRTVGAHMQPGGKLFLSESGRAGDFGEMFTRMMNEAGFGLIKPIWELGLNTRYILLGEYKGAQG